MQETQQTAEDQARPAGKLKKYGRPAAAAALALALGTGGMLAYFTGTDTVENEFTVSAGMANKIEVVEPSWDTTDEDADGVPDAAEDLVPLQEVAKDPAVANKSDVEAWAFIQVKVPAAEVSLLKEDGTPGEPAMAELFTYQVNDGWAEFGEPATEGGYTTHTYLCDEKVAAGATTPAVFDSVTLVNLVEAQGTSGADSIDVTGMAIQAEGFDSPEAAWAAYRGQNA